MPLSGLRHLTSCKWLCRNPLTAYQLLLTVSYGSLQIPIDRYVVHSIEKQLHSLCAIDSI